jgi:predicted nucleic acid-binding protein
MTVVVDANIMIAFGLVEEPLHTQAKQILSTWQTTGEHLTAPRLFRSEITAVVRKAVYQQRISPQQGRNILAQLLNYPVEFYEDDALLKEAYELAVRFNRPRAYDTQYMALASRLQCDFWTADERLVNSTQGEFTHIRWIGDWTFPNPSIP